MTTVTKARKPNAVGRPIPPDPAGRAPWWNAFNAMAAQGRLTPANLEAMAHYSASGGEIFSDALKHLREGRIMKTVHSADLTKVWLEFDKNLSVAPTPGQKRALDAIVRRPPLNVANASSGEKSLAVQRAPWRMEDGATSRISVAGSPDADGTVSARIGDKVVRAPYTAGESAKEVATRFARALARAGFKNTSVQPAGEGFSVVVGR